MSVLDFMDYLHHHDSSRDLAWELLHALRARHARTGVAAACHD